MYGQKEFWSGKNTQRKVSRLEKHALDSKYGGLNVCDRTVKHKKTFCDVRRNVKESTRSFHGLWMLPKWLGKKVRWKIWTKFTKKNAVGALGLETKGI